MRVAEFLRNLIACKDWYDGKVYLMEIKIFDIIKFLAVDYLLCICCYF